LSNGVALPCQRSGEPVQRRDGCGDVAALSIEHADEVVEAGEQVAYLILATVERGIEFRDDVPDLAQSASVDDDRQGRQRLLGGRIGR
jgi:hypothetical protein